MNIKRFKKVLAVYILLFVALCLLVPMNVSAKTNDSIYKNGETYSTSKSITSLGVIYMPIWTPEYYNFDERTRLDTYVFYGEGYVRAKPHIAFWIVELVILTIVFYGVSYITCKREYIS